jgi:hypothetical protein
LIHLAIHNDITVANDAVAVLTILFQIRIAIIILSGMRFSFASAFDHDFFSFTSALTLWIGTEVNAVSLQEKNIESKISIRNAINDKGSIGL